MTESKDAPEHKGEEDRTEFNKKAVATATLGMTALFLDWLLGDEEAYLLADGSVQVVKKGFFSSMFLGDEAGAGRAEVQPILTKPVTDIGAIVEPIRKPVLFNDRKGTKSTGKHQFFSDMKKAKHTDDSVVDLFNIMGRLIDR